MQLTCAGIVPQCATIQVLAYSSLQFPLIYRDFSFFLHNSTNTYHTKSMFRILTTNFMQNSTSIQNSKSFPHPLCPARAATQHKIHMTTHFTDGIGRISHTGHTIPRIKYISLAIDAIDGTNYLTRIYYHHYYLRTQIYAVAGNSYALSWPS
jgi:hypothetical protein